MLKQVISTGLSLLIAVSLTYSASAEQSKSFRSAKSTDQAQSKKMQSDARKVNLSKRFIKLEKKANRDKTKYKKEIELIDKLESLNAQVAGADLSNTQLFSTFNTQYQQIETQTNNLVNAAGGSGGPAGCMVECDEAYPGVGGGNAANRIACKLSCLVIPGH